MSLPLLTAPYISLSLCPHLSPHPGHVCPSLTVFPSVSPPLPPNPLPTTLLTQVFLLTSVIHSLLGGDLQTCGTMDEGGLDDNGDWEEERELERVACEGDDFTPPKIMVGDVHILQ